MRGGLSPASVATVVVILSALGVAVVVVVLSALGKLGNLKTKKMLEKFEKSRFQELLTYLSE